MVPSPQREGSTQPGPQPDWPYWALFEPLSQASGPFVTASPQYGPSVQVPERHLPYSTVETLAAPSSHSSGGVKVTPVCGDGFGPHTGEHVERGARKPCSVRRKFDSSV